jgi:hypothetical protein
MTWWGGVKSSELKHGHVNLMQESVSEVDFFGASEFQDLAPIVFVGATGDAGNILGRKEDGSTKGGGAYEYLCCLLGHHQRGHDAGGTAAQADNAVIP